MYKTMNEEKITFLRNRSWDLCEGIELTDIPNEVEEWAKNGDFGNNEEGYLVKYDEQFGYLYIEEYSHDKQIDSEEKNFALERGLKSEEVLAGLQLKAEKLSEEADKSITVMVGNETGFFERHEFCIFFPVVTSGETYKQTLDLSNSVK